MEESQLLAPMDVGTLPNHIDPCVDLPPSSLEFSLTLFRSKIFNKVVDSYTNFTR